MSINLRWLPSPRASGLHAAAALAQGRRLADARLAETLRQKATALAASLEFSGATPGIWRQLIPLSAIIENTAELVQVSLTAEAGQVAHGAQANPTAVAQVAARLVELERAFLTLYSRLPDELVLRSGPLAEQWEARGPGLWRQLASLTAVRPLASSATVLLVHPALGGGGAAYSAHGSVSLEAVLANPRPELPEVVRLAWLLAQLPGEPAAHQESAAAEESSWEALALIPAVLAAAEQVELTVYSPTLVERALEAWWPELPDRQAIGPRLCEWWLECRQRKMNWSANMTHLRAH